MIFFDIALASNGEGTITWAGLPWWAWFLIFLAVVLFLWWRLSVSAKEMEGEVKTITADDHGEVHKPDEGEGMEDEVEQLAPVDTAAVEAVVSEAEPAAPDDLTAIEGIGPKISSLLQDAGIRSYAQLAIADPAHLEEVVKGAGLHMADVSTWPDQAQFAMQGKWDELSQLQDELKGGRREE
jgi:large subunit ribosomal protein L17